MRIVLFGATGMVGQRVLAEAVRRGHTVTAVARDPSKITIKSDAVTPTQADLTDAARVATLVAGHDVVVSAYAPPAGKESTLSDVTRTLIAAVAATVPSPRLLAVGGAGGLEVAPGVRLIDTPQFPDFVKPIAQAHIDAAKLYAAATIDWTIVAPAALIQPGERTGQYRSAEKTLVTDAAGNSSISAEDYAVALLDELETPKHRRVVMTAAN